MVPRFTNIMLVSFITLCLIALITSSTYANQLPDMYLTINDNQQPVHPNAPALFQYIDAHDVNTAYEYSGPFPDTLNNVNIYRIQLSSLAWLHAKETDKPIWTHNVTLIIPPSDSNRIPNAGALYITGCQVNDHKCEDKQYLTVAGLAQLTGMTIIVLTQAPVSPILFTHDIDQKNRTEDDLLGFSFHFAHQNPDRPDTNILFPIVKAAKITLDVVEKLSIILAAKGEFITPISRFISIGASKRGVASQLLHVYESQRVVPRLVGTAFMVSDGFLNFFETLGSMYQRLGGWTFAFEAFRNNSVADLLYQDDAAQRIVSHMDALSTQYGHLFTKLPTLDVSAANDEFFLLGFDTSYWSRIQSNSRRLVIDHAEHMLLTGLGTLYPALAGWSRQLLLQNDALPDLSWDINIDQGTIFVITSVQPQEAVVFRGESNPSTDGTPNRMDFRTITHRDTNDECPSPSFGVTKELCFNPTLWPKEEIQFSWSDDHVAYIAKWSENNIPTDGRYVASFIKITYPSIGQIPAQIYTTQPMILPNVYPFESCVKLQNCTGTIV